MLPPTAQPAVYQNPLAPNLTERDLSSHLGAVTSKGGLNVGFYYARVQLKSRRALYNGRFETRLFVAIQPKGDRYTLAKEPINEVAAQRTYPAEFAAFKNYQDSPTRGTPLMDLPGISQSQIALLSVNGIRSIEDLLSLSPDIVAQVGMEASTAFKIAKRWSDRKAEAGDDVDMARQMAALEVENKTYRDALKGMEAQMAAMQAKMDAMASMTQASPAAVQPIGQVPHGAAADGIADDLPDTVFGDNGGQGATGNDDLNDNEPDPLKE